MNYRFVTLGSFRRQPQDYALLQTLAVDPDGPLLRDLKSFEEFPKPEAWLLATRRRLLRA